MPINMWLHDMNPSVKFIVVIVSMLTLAWFFNPWTPFLFFIGITFFQVVFSQINWRLWGLLMIPIAFTAIGYLWTTIVFAADTSGEILFSWNGWTVTVRQWNTALSLAFRVFAFSAMSFMFALTTDPVKFVMSLMQQLRLSPKLAYGVMVGYQFLPVVKEEFIQIRHAHRLRGIGAEKQKWKRIVGIKRLIIPLLASAVRRAERSAFAMEARGFTGEKREVFYEPILPNIRDGILSILLLTLLIGCCLAGWQWS